MDIKLGYRENQALGLIAQGKTNKEIARITGVGLGGVCSTLRRILFKFDARNRTELIAKAIRAGIIQLTLVGVVVQSLTLFWDLTNNVPDGDPIRHRGGIRSRITRRNRSTRSIGNRTLLALNALTNGTASELYQHYDLQALEETA